MGFFAGEKSSQALAALVRGLEAETPAPTHRGAGLGLPSVLWGSGAALGGIPCTNPRSPSPLQPTPRDQPPALSLLSPPVPSRCP